MRSSQPPAPPREGRPEHRRCRHGGQEAWRGPGEFDNNSDGVVSAIFHVVDAYELATTGIKRRAGEVDPI